MTNSTPPLTDLRCAVVFCCFASTTSLADGFSNLLRFAFPLRDGALLFTAAFCGTLFVGIWCVVRGRGVSSYLLEYELSFILGEVQKENIKLVSF